MLEEELASLSYAELFLYGDQEIPNALWEKYGGEAVFSELLLGEEAAFRSVFLAYEIWRSQTEGLPSVESLLLSSAYVAALAETAEGRDNALQLNANLWGLLGYQDDVGELGAVLVECGENAVPHLVALLEDEAAMLYEGSREAMTGNRQAFQVRDFAAFYLAQIWNLEFPYTTDRSSRNAQIDKLKAHSPEEK